MSNLIWFLIAIGLIVLIIIAMSSCSTFKFKLNDCGCKEPKTCAPIYPQPCIIPPPPPCPTCPIPPPPQSCPSCPSPPPPQSCPSCPSCPPPPSPLSCPVCPDCPLPPELLPNPSAPPLPSPPVACSNCEACCTCDTNATPVTCSLLGSPIPNDACQNPQCSTFECDLCGSSGVITSGYISKMISRGGLTDCQWADKIVTALAGGVGTQPSGDCTSTWKQAVMVILSGKDTLTVDDENAICSALCLQGASSHIGNCNCSTRTAYHW